MKKKNTGNTGQPVHRYSLNVRFRFATKNRFNSIYLYFFPVYRKRYRADTVTAYFKPGLIILFSALVVCMFAIGFRENTQNSGESKSLCTQCQCNLFCVDKASRFNAVSYIQLKSNAHYIE